jgi:outer membrane protein assembly factor BamD (BamD/ComL family)
MIKSIMKQNSLIILTSVFLLFGITSCSSKKQKLADEILQQEKSLYSDSSMVPDPVKAKKIIDSYVSYADQFPEDTLSANYLFKAGDISSKINEIEQSIQLFARLLKTYPDNRNAPFAIFLQGFIYENQAGDAVKARPYYEEFLRKYPDHPIAGDVSFSLENLGKSPEELIREFESMNGSDSTLLADTVSVSAK